MSLEEVIQEIALSINNQQVSLNQLIQKEKEKIIFFIDNGATADELLQVNESVNKMIDEINKLEEILNQKLLLIAPYLKNNVNKLKED